MAPSDDLRGPPESQKKRGADDPVEHSDSTLPENEHKRQKLDHQPANLPSQDTTVPTATVPPCHQAYLSQSTINLHRFLTYTNGITRLLGEELIKIRVGKGDNCQVHLVHKKLLSQHSAFFDAAINGGFRESHESEIVLEEDNPLIFEFFLTWLYTSRFPSHTDYADICVRLREEIGIVFLRLLSMSDKYIAPDLEALCYEQIREVLSDDTCPSVEFVRGRYDVTIPASQLRHYVVEMGTYNPLDETIPLLFRDKWKGVLDDVESFSHDVSRAIIRTTALKTDQRPKTTHPYNITHFKKLREKETVSSSLRCRSGRKCETPPPETDIDDPDGLIKTICSNIAGIQWDDDKDLDSIRWPHKLPSERAMRGAGLYHAPTMEEHDRVRCTRCEFESVGWKPDHKPFLTHQKLSPDCPFVLATEMGLQPPLLPDFMR